MGISKLFSIITIAFLILNVLGKAYEYGDTSKRAGKDFQLMTKKINILSKNDKENIGFFGMGILIGVIGTSIIKR